MAMTPFSSSAAFFNSVGVNTHLNYFDLNYGNAPLVTSQLAALGVAHVRDGFHTLNDDFDNILFSAWKLVADLGIKFNAVVDPREKLGPITPALLNSFWWKSGMSVESLEGPNEFDISGDPNWVANLKVYQSNLYNCAKQMAQGISMPVYGPSMAYTPNAGSVGNISATMDYGNLHPYPAGQMPTVIFPSQPAYIRQMCGTKPIVATETGYHNALFQDPAKGQPGVSELAAAKYTLRLLADNFKNGLRRTYIYELQDEGSDPSQTNAEHNWGLVRWNSTVKPAFSAVRNLLCMLAKSSVLLRPVDCTLSGAPVSSLLLQQDETNWLLMLWQEVSVYNLSTGKDIANPPVSVTMTLGTATLGAWVKVAVYEPLLQDNPVAEYQGNTAIGLAVPDHPLVVKITAA